MKQSAAAGADNKLHQGEYYEVIAAIAYEANIAEMLQMQPRC